jgi:hypothetical protein
MARHCRRLAGDRRHRQDPLNRLSTGTAARQVTPSPPHSREHRRRPAPPPQPDCAKLRMPHPAPTQFGVPRDNRPCSPAMPPPPRDPVVLRRRLPSRAPWRRQSRLRSRCSSKLHPLRSIYSMMFSNSLPGNRRRSVGRNAEHAARVLSPVGHKCSGTRALFRSDENQFWAASHQGICGGAMAATKTAKLAGITIGGTNPAAGSARRSQPSGARISPDDPMSLRCFPRSGNAAADTGAPLDARFRENVRTPWFGP